MKNVDQKERRSCGKAGGWRAILGLGLLIWLSLSGEALGSYLATVRSGGASSLAVLPGQSFFLDVELESTVADKHDSAEFLLHFSVPGLELQSYVWQEPYLAGGADDASIPPVSALPVTVTEATVVGGEAFPAGEVELYFSNLAAGLTPAGPGRLLRLKLRVPASFSGPNVITIGIVPRLIALGFDAVETVAGDLFRLRIDRGTGIPALPQPRGAMRIGADLVAFGLDSPTDGDLITVDPGTGDGSFLVSFKSAAETNVVRVEGVTGRIIVFGQRGDDEIRVNPAIELSAELYGGPGNDILSGGSGPDSLFGEEGNDFVLSSSGFDTFSGGPGQDGVVFYGTPGDDHITVQWYLLDQDKDSHEVVHPPFPAHHDGIRIRINDQRFEMDYTPQDDFETIVIHAGAGNDFVEMLNDAAAQHWNGEFYGDEGDDILIGSRNLSDKHRGNDRLFGGPGDDQLFGYSGNDTLDGGPGRDQIDAGQGVNRVITDGEDEITINARDTVELAVDYPGARSASIDWGDGVTQPTQVDAASGLVSGRHQYDLGLSGRVNIRVTTRDGAGESVAHVITASATTLPVNHLPGMMLIERRNDGQLLASFPGIPGFTYVIESNSDLNENHWVTTARIVCDLNGRVNFSLPDSVQELARFFRAIAEVDLPQP